MSGGEDAWIRRGSRTVDQRDYRLPPAWVERPARRITGEETGLAIHVSGPKRHLGDRIASLLAGARRKAVLSSFLLADSDIEDAILVAARRGVRVYVLLASEARLEIEDGSGEFETAMRDRHHEMLRRLGGHVLFRSAPHFHAKFVLADPGEAGRAGLLLTANLTREALERNEELGVELTGEEVDEAFALARWAFWEEAEHELVDPEDRFRSVKPLASLAHPEALGTVRATTSVSRELAAEAERIVETAQRSLMVASFGWDEDHGVVEALCARAREGVAVTALARLRESQMPALLALAGSGARVLGFKWLHAKALCAADDMALVMSANLQRDGLDRGFELGVPLGGGRSREVRERLDQWSEAARWQLLPSPTLGDIEGTALVWRKNRFDEMKVEAGARVDLGSVTAESVDRLGDTTPPVPPPEGELPRPAHEVVYEWDIRAPVLAANSSEVLRSSSNDDARPVAYDPPAFDEPGGRRVVAVRSMEDVERARQVAAETGATAIVLRKGRASG